MNRKHAKKKHTHKIGLIILAILIVIGVIAIPKILPKEKEETKKELNIHQTANQAQLTNANKEEKEEPKKEVIEKKELFEEYYNKAEKLMENMTLEEKVGQIFLARYPESGVIKEIQEENPGGYILFGRDFENATKESIIKQLRENQEKSKIPLVLGVDEEGGTVVRVSAYKAFRSSKFQSPQNIWAKGQLPAILKDSKEKSELLKSLGLNMNLAPVADVPTSSSDYIYKRSYGRGAEKTAIYVSSLIKTMNEDKMISTMKHFPGYGNNKDTHTGSAIDNRSYETFEKTDFLPFKSGIEAGAPTILVSHNIVKCMDAGKPASLSEKVHEILRKELNFSGLIMTDDLAMDAVKDYNQNGGPALQAVIAGNDLIISSDFKLQKKQIIDAIKNGKINEETINSSVKKILAWKYAYEVIK